MIQLMVGLGNPGAEYANTRHNAGAWLVEGIAEKYHAILRSNARFHGHYVMAKIEQHPCHLLLPTTFMNHSGQAVQSISSYYKIASENILIIHDEIDLPIGTVRLKWEGGHGGHNGLRDIMQHLNTRGFYRLRIGVGRPAHSKEVIDYVLKNPSQAERQQIDTACAAVYPVLPLLLAGDYQKVMRQLHQSDTP